MSSCDANWCQSMSDDVAKSEKVLHVVEVAVSVECLNVLRSASISQPHYRYLPLLQVTGSYIVPSF